MTEPGPGMPDAQGSRRGGPASIRIPDSDLDARIMMIRADSEGGLLGQLGRLARQLALLLVLGEQRGQRAAAAQRVPPALDLLERLLQQDLEVGQLAVDVVVGLGPYPAGLLAHVGQDLRGPGL